MEEVWATMQTNDEESMNQPKNIGQIMMRCCECHCTSTPETHQEPPIRDGEWLYVYLVARCEWCGVLNFLLCSKIAAYVRVDRVDGSKEFIHPYSDEAKHCLPHPNRGQVVDMVK